MIETHSKAAESSNVVYHEFLLCYKGTEPVVYGFVEGKDDPCFYRGAVEHCLPSGWRVRFINARNRDGVIAVNELLDWDRFDRRRVCAFIDQDLTLFCGQSPISNNTYMTDGYSIENSVVNSDTAERILTEMLGVSSATMEELERIRALFSSGLSRFADYMAIVMAQLILWRRSESKPNLGDLRLSSLFIFAAGVLECEPRCGDPNDRLQAAIASIGSAERAATPELLAAEAEFRHANVGASLVRGKYVLWFLVEFLKQVHSNVSLFFRAHPIPPKPKVTIGVNNAVAVVAPRARVPESLRAFLARTYVAYVNDKTAGSGQQQLLTDPRTAD